VRFTAGYVTAPQCSPSRAGLLTGRYQQRIGIDTIPDIPLPLEEVTIAERLRSAGYATGMVGKWHLEPNALCKAWAQEHRPGLKPDANGRLPIPVKDRLAYFPHQQGFTDQFTGEMGRYYANYDLSGKDREPAFLDRKGFRIDTQTEAALAFIRRRQKEPFFLYLAYFAPHTPLELAEPYAKEFPKDLPVRRRAALSMIRGVDVGVGRITELLRELKLDDNTLIVFTSDNGAPLKKLRDTPISGDPGGWDGSLNTPWVGEKGMLTEGGIRVPFLVRWPGAIPGGRVIDTPVSTLDVAPTALSLAGMKPVPDLDGIDLLPLLKDPTHEATGRPLFWRFWSQLACRDGRWKYLKVADQAEFLFDLESDGHEKVNVGDQYPDKLKQLREKAFEWAAELKPAGPPAGRLNVQEVDWYREYFGLMLHPEKPSP
jgi:arylsulfatase A-like enzyme